MVGLVTIGQFIASILGAGTVGGLVSGELSRRLVMREDRKKHLGGLLCDLLEVRHDIIGISETTKALASHLPGQGDQLAVAMPAIIGMIVDPAKLHEHYEAAVIELAGLDPILAYHLRSKNLVGTALGTLSKLALQDPTGIPVAAQAFKIFTEAGTSALDEAILRVASELGRSVRRGVRKILEKKQEMPLPANQVLSLIPQLLQAMHREQTQSAQAPPTPEQRNASGGQATKGPA